MISSLWEAHELSLSLKNLMYLQIFWIEGRRGGSGERREEERERERDVKLIRLRLGVNVSVEHRAETKVETELSWSPH